MLVVDSVVPGGPADGLLEPGDVLVRLQGEVVVHFLPMEGLLDDRVGQRVNVEVERGGQLLSRSIQVRATGTQGHTGTSDGCCCSGTPCAVEPECMWSWHACSAQEECGRRCKTCMLCRRAPSWRLPGASCTA